MVPSSPTAMEVISRQRGIEEHVAFAFGADAVDEPRSVGAGDQIALRVPGQRADVRFIGLEKGFRLRAGLGGIDAVDGAGIAGGDVQAAGLVEGRDPRCSAASRTCRRSILSSSDFAV